MGRAGFALRQGVGFGRVAGASRSVRDAAEFAKIPIAEAGCRTLVASRFALRGRNPGSVGTPDNRYTCAGKSNSRTSDRPAEPHDRPPDRELTEVQGLVE